MRHGLCKGDVWAKGHRLIGVGADMIFCGRCGAYSVGRTDYLYEVCAGKPWSPTSAKAKGFLHEGKHPVSGVFLGEPIPLVRFFKAVPNSTFGDVDDEISTLADVEDDIVIDDITSILHDNILRAGAL